MSRNARQTSTIASRRTTKVVDGVSITGWFTEDFTLAELRTLRAKERLPLVRQRNTIYDGRYRVPTFQEVIDLSKRLSRELKRPIGIYPETKHSTFFALNAANRTNAARFEDVVVSILHANYGNTPNAPVFLQSFEVANLQYLSTQTDIRLVQLLSGAGARPS